MKEDGEDDADDGFCDALDKLFGLEVHLVENHVNAVD